MLQKINNYLKSKATKYIVLGGLAGAILIGCGGNKSEIDIPQIENRLEKSLEDNYLTKLEQKLILT